MFLRFKISSNRLTKIIFVCLGFVKLPKSKIFVNVGCSLRYYMKEYADNLKGKEKYRIFKVLNWLITPYRYKMMVENIPLKSTYSEVRLLLW